MTDAEAIAFTKSYDLATARAESRHRLGLPIERGNPYADRITPLEPASDHYSDLLWYQHGGNL